MNTCNHGWQQCLPSTGGYLTVASKDHLFKVWYIQDSSQVFHNKLLNCDFFYLISQHQLLTRQFGFVFLYFTFLGIFLTASKMHERRCIHPSIHLQKLLNPFQGAGVVGGNPATVVRTGCYSTAGSHLNTHMHTLGQFRVTNKHEKHVFLDCAQGEHANVTWKVPSWDPNYCGAFSLWGQSANRREKIHPKSFRFSPKNVFFCHTRALSQHVEKMEPMPASTFKVEVTHTVSFQLAAERRSATEDNEVKFMSA